jgi:hypothetical protein
LHFYHFSSGTRHILAFDYRPQPPARLLLLLVHYRPGFRHYQFLLDRLFSKWLELEDLPLIIILVRLTSPPSIISSKPPFLPLPPNSDLPLSLSLVNIPTFFLTLQ